MISGCVSGNRGVDCGGSSSLSGGFYSSCGIKDGRKGGGDRGGGGRGNEGCGGGSSMCDCLSFCRGMRTITMITTPASVPEVEFVLCTGEQTDENRAYEQEDEYFDKEDLCKAGKRFVHDTREAAGEGTGRRGRIWGALVSAAAAVVQERCGLWAGREWLQRKGRFGSPRSLELGDLGWRSAMMTVKDSPGGRQDGA